MIISYVFYFHTMACKEFLYKKCVGYSGMWMDSRYQNFLHIFGYGNTFFRQLQLNCNHSPFPIMQKLDPFQKFCCCENTVTQKERTVIEEYTKIFVLFLQYLLLQYILSQFTNSTEVYVCIFCIIIIIIVDNYFQFQILVTNKVMKKSWAIFENFFQLELFFQVMIIVLVKCLFVIFSISTNFEFMNIIKNCNKINCKSQQR
eukprot:TRINITY_DN1961_c0_g1_i2.p1 TRINITY_DN1961_c0_g1~~TRINITY_DN1961_c0_g1_i2.p1  ORF type:complete len:202 (+),score=-8.29 TRINITY_DN1961_c0_g1_i2:1093-1698(+)